MNTKFKDLTGQRFGKLTVLAPTKKRRNRAVVWKLRCDCGEEEEGTGAHLRSGHLLRCAFCRRAPVGKTEFSKRLRSRREVLGLTTKELAVSAGLKNSRVICALERGSSDPRLQMVLALAAALKADLNWLTGRDI